MLNSSGAQDLVVHILARNQRYEVANYENVTIPTNIDVQDSVRERFGEFYAALFDTVLERNPNSVVTEYAWQATNCDPCPGPVLSSSDLLTLGADVSSGESAPLNGPIRWELADQRAAMEDVVGQLFVLGGVDVAKATGQHGQGASVRLQRSFVGRGVNSAR